MRIALAADVVRGYYSVRALDEQLASTRRTLALREDNLKLVESFRAVKDAAEAAKDNATSGIVDEWTDQAEERAWFLFEASRKG